MTIEQLHRLNRKNLAKTDKGDAKPCPCDLYATPGHVQQNRYQLKGRARKGRTNIAHCALRAAISSTRDILRVQT